MKMICRRSLKEHNLHRKFCFVLSSGCIILSAFFLFNYPALLLYFFSVLLVICMVIRVITYWQENYILFMLDMCYFHQCVVDSLCMGVSPFQ
ncbi:hypothetical protein FGIG_12471 [Fasciola gigantica]|uniref:Glycerophosphocholine acyltransferase 1 n=1 Tax=Fasciola gigantica TaxID=46835 RepID=A0A504YNG5_FASGI|nr:hypothetical protein FGIG_12471 [Fasciola gigantica]